MDWSVDDVLRSISEDLDDVDTFGFEDYWNHTFQFLIDIGGTGEIERVLRNTLPSDHILEVGESYVIMSLYGNVTSSPAYQRRVKINFDPQQTIKQWLRSEFMPKLREIQQDKTLTREHHPLFFEDENVWGTEAGKPWGWQATVMPVQDTQPRTGEGLDDVDEFITGDENWQVTITNKNIPDKALSGVIYWDASDLGGHLPHVRSVDRDDFNMSKEFAQKLIWGAYWASEEENPGRSSAEPFEIDAGNLLQVDNSGIELLKYYNDPEHYGKEYPSKPKGWGSVGTHTYGEARETPYTKYVNGKVFTNVYETDLTNLFMNTWYWPAPGSTDAAYRSPDEIMDDYPKMFIHWAPSLNISDYLESNAPEPQSTGTGLDDVDEFEIDDPEVDMQKWTDAETLAVREAHDRMLKEFATLDRGYKLLYVGAKTSMDHQQQPDGVYVIKPYAIITRVPVTEDLDDKDTFQKEEYNFSGILRYPKSMGTTKEAKQAAVDKLNTWLLDRSLSFQLNTSSANVRDSRWYPEHVFVDIHGEMSEEMYEDVRNEFIEQDEHPDAIATYGSLQQEPFITLELRFADNEWILPHHSPPEPDDDDPEFYKDRDKLDESIVEDLDDVDEFTEDDPLTPVSATVIQKRLPGIKFWTSRSVVDIAKHIIIDNGYMAGEFIESKRIDNRSELKIFGKLEVSESILDWIKEENGQLILRNYGLEVILEMPDVAAYRIGGFDV